MSKNRQLPKRRQSKSVDRYADPRWQRRRLEILSRDDWKCVACGDATSTLHVHHKVYGGNLWDSADDELQTLCETCHTDLGPHPKGGIWWEEGSREECGGVWVFAQCPACGCQKLKDKGTFVKCFGCGDRLAPPESADATDWKSDPRFGLPEWSCLDKVLAYYCPPPSKTEFSIDEFKSMMDKKDDPFFAHDTASQWMKVKFTDDGRMQILEAGYGEPPGANHEAITP